MAEIYLYNPKRDENKKGTGNKKRTDFLNKYKVEGQNGAYSANAYKEETKNKRKISKNKSLRRELKRYITIGGISIATLIAAYGGKKMVDYVQDKNAEINVEMTDEKLQQILENYINENKITEEDMIYIKDNIEVACDEILNPLEEELITELETQEAKDANGLENQMKKDYKSVKFENETILDRVDGTKQFTVINIDGNTINLDGQSVSKDAKTVLKAGANLEDIKEQSKEELSTISDKELVEQYLKNAETIMRKTRDKELKIKKVDGTFVDYKIYLEEKQKEQIAEKQIDDEMEL